MITAVLLLSLLQSSPNTLTPAERTAGWQLLFDGRTLAGWRGVGYDTVPTAHWVVVNGAIKKIASGDVPRVADGRPLVGGDLMTRDSFADFALTFERSEEHTSELQSLRHLVCRLLLEKKK